MVSVAEPWQLKERPGREIEAVVFDAYGTLFDVYSVALLAEQLFPGRGQALSLLWRDKQIEYTHLVSTSSHGAHYRPDNGFCVMGPCKGRSLKIIPVTEQNQEIIINVSSITKNTL